MPEFLFYETDPFCNQKLKVFSFNKNTAVIVTEQPQQPSIMYTDKNCLYTHKIWFHVIGENKYRVYDVMTQYISLPAVTIIGVGKYTEKDSSGNIIDEYIYHVVSRYNPQKTVELERYKEFQDNAFVCFLSQREILNHLAPTTTCEARTRFTVERSSLFTFCAIHQTNYVLYYLQPGPNVANKNHEFFACELEYDKSSGRELIRDKSSQCSDSSIFLIEPNAIFSDQNFVVWKIEEKSPGWPTPAMDDFFVGGLYTIEWRVLKPN